MTQKSNLPIYNGDIGAGSLLVGESRLVAGLLLDGVDDQTWRRAIMVENILQKRNPESARRQARLVRQRLENMPADLLHIVAHGGMDACVQATLAAAIKHSRLLGDFMDTMIRQHWQTFQPKLTVQDWTYYLEICVQIDPRVKDWTKNTQSKLKQVVFRILAEAGYVDSTRSLRLLPVQIVPDVRRSLEAHDEIYILRCMEAANQ